MTQSAVSVEIRGNTECGVMKLRKENTFFFKRMVLIAQFC